MVWHLVPFPLPPTHVHTNMFPAHTHVQFTFYSISSLFKVEGKLSHSFRRETTGDHTNPVSSSVTPVMRQYSKDNLQNWKSQDELSTYCLFSFKHPSLLTIRILMFWVSLTSSFICPSRSNFSLQHRVLRSWALPMQSVGSLALWIPLGFGQWVSLAGDQVIMKVMSG